MTRHRCLMIGVVAMGVVALAACGSTSPSASVSTSSPPPVSSGASSPLPASVSTSAQMPTSTMAAAAGTGEVRLGCGTHCQTAGGYGATTVPGMLEVVRIENGTVDLEADGYVPVTVTCLIPATCRGVLLLGLNGYQEPPSQTRVEYAGRSDLLVDPMSTQTIGVPLTPGAAAFARAHGPVTVNVNGDVNATADCSEIPQLAAHCAETVAADSRAGDGLERLFHGELQLNTM